MGAFLVVQKGFEVMVIIMKPGTSQDAIHALVEKLEKQERVHEIAQMMSGEVLTDAAMENAALLLSKS